MFSWMVDARVPRKGLEAKFIEAKCVEGQYFPPPESAERFSEMANLMVNIGLRLRSG